MSKHSKSPHPVTQENPQPYQPLLLLPFAVLLLLNLTGMLFPSVMTWGFNVWGSFPVWVFPAVVLLFAVCAIPRVATSLSNAVVSVVNWCERRSLFCQVVIVTLVSVIVGAKLMLFRSNAPIYGDGFSVIENSTIPVLSFPDSLHEMIKLLPVLIYRAGAWLFVRQLHFTPQMSFGIVSCLGGIVGFWGLWKLARAVGRGIEESVTLMAAGLASGCTILFFGHLELYPWGIAFLLWLLAAGVNYLRGKNSALVVWLWIILALAMEVMFFPTVMVIVLMLVASRKSSEPGGPPFAFGLSFGTVGWLILACSVVGGIVVNLVSTGATFVPLWPNAICSYSVLCLSHLIDLANLTFLVAPLILISLVLFSVRGKRGEKPAMDPVEKLLGLFAVSLFLVMIWIDPCLGAVRDWDLLSFFGFPASILAVRLLLSRFPGRTSQSLLMTLSWCTVLLIVAPQVVDRANGERALARLDPMLWDDPHYQAGYDNAHAALPWASTLQNYTGHAELADRYLWRKIGLDPGSSMCWFNLGEIELRRGHSDSAAVMLEKAYKLSPGNENFIVRYAQALHDLKQRDKLLPLLPRLVSTQSNDQKFLVNAGVVLANEGMTAEALAKFRTAHALRPWDYDITMYLGQTFSNIRQSDSALFYFRRALIDAPVSARAGVYKEIIREQYRRRRLDEARSTFDEFRRRFPNDPEIGQIQNILNGQK